MRSHSESERAGGPRLIAAAEPQPLSSLRPFLQRNLWLIALIALVAAVYLIGLSLLPLVLGAIVAYVAHPVADMLERRGFRRGPAVALLVLVLFAAIFGAVLLLTPVIVAKIRDFLAAMPRLQETAVQRFWPAAAPYAALLGIDEAAIRNTFPSDIAQALKSWMPTLGHGAFAALNLVFLVMLTPFVTFYLLRDWHRILRRTTELVPRRSQATVSQLAAKIDRRLAGFIRGQTLICILQGAWHVVGYSLIGLPGAVPLGLAMGISNYIPFIGNALVFMVALGVAAVHFGTIGPIAAVVGLYVVSQIVEDGILYPGIVGDRIKLHPVWVIAVLLIAGAQFGLTGALLAIPITCVIEVLVAHAVERYRQSEFYREP
jgi:predicted PurR-regulated permease PerM